MRVVHAYADTSVFGGIADQEFVAISEAFFQEVRQGRISLVISALVQSELLGAPEVVRILFDDMLPWTEVAPISDEALDIYKPISQPAY